MVSESAQRTLKAAQKNEITEHHIYKKLSDICRDAHNSEVLLRISSDELRHYGMWKQLTGIEVKPNWYNYFKYVLIARTFGLTFAVKLMENGEKGAQVNYGALIAEVPQAEAVQKDESFHESSLIAMISEEKLQYIGSVVLGLNDALVELTGTLAGLTFALQNTKLIGVAGLITGIAASLSMAASEYLSTKTEGGERTP